jgi:fibronectin type 3 domain-containing protein
VALALLTGCQSFKARLEREIFTENLELTMDRPSDLRPPEGLRVSSTSDRAIDLTWSPVLVGDVAGYAVLRSPDLTGDFALIGQTSSRFGTVYHDSGTGEEQLGDGQTYYYRVHPYDRAGRVSRSHSYVAATTDPRPDAPAGLRAYSNLPRSVVVVWDPSEGRSTHGYTVLRSPTVAGPWERVGFAEGRLNTVYEDDVPGDLRVMYYRVVATNRFGGESDQTEPVRAVTKADPLPPIGLEVAARRLGRVDLAWAPNVEPDLTRYEVWRSVEDSGGWRIEELIGSADASSTHFADPDVGCGQVVRYRLRVVDSDGLTSSYSQPLEAVGETIGLELATDNGKPVLRWDPVRAADWPAARVYELRKVLPDRELALVENRSHIALPELSSGTRRLAVVLTSVHPSENGHGDAPRCELTARIP